MRSYAKLLYLGLFTLYNLLYAFYMGGVLPRMIYMASLLLVTMFSGTVVALRYRRSGAVRKTLLMALLIPVVFFAISLIYQTSNTDFQGYLITELLYFIVPPIVTYAGVDILNDKEYHILFYIVFAKLVLFFLLKNRSTLSLSLILNISFSNSDSSAFEMLIAHDFFLMMILFTFFRKPLAALLSFGMCLITFKRLPFLLAICFLLFIAVIQFLWLCGFRSIKRRLTNWILKPPSRKFVGLVTIGFLLAPIVMKLTYSPLGAALFRNLLHMDLNKFTSGRYNIVNYALENAVVNGLGSITHFYENFGGKYVDIGNMHCDVLRLAMEVTYFGFGFYALMLTKLFRRNRLSFYFLCYAILELMFSHVADNLNLWTLLYLVLAFTEKTVHTETLHAETEEGR